MQMKKNGGMIIDWSSCLELKQQAEHTCERADFFSRGSAIEAHCPSRRQQYLRTRTQQDNKTASTDSETLETDIKGEAE